MSATLDLVSSKTKYVSGGRVLTMSRGTDEGHKEDGGGTVLATAGTVPKDRGKLGLLTND
jgi:hypothetical protein